MYLYKMETLQVKNDFELMAKAYEAHVRDKAILAGGNIIYAQDGQLIKENPKTLQKTVLKKDLAIT